MDAELDASLRFDLLQLDEPPPSAEAGASLPLEALVSLPGGAVAPGSWALASPPAAAPPASPEPLPAVGSPDPDELLVVPAAASVPPAPPEVGELGSDPATTVVVEVVVLAVETTTFAAVTVEDREESEVDVVETSGGGAAGGVWAAGESDAAGTGVVCVVAPAPEPGVPSAAEAACAIDSCATNAATTTPANIPRRFFIPTT